MVVPAYTLVASATAAVRARVVPVFVDVDPEAYCLDPSSVESMMSDRTAAIVPVRLAGLPADLGALTAIARRYGVAVVEDAAEAWGARREGRSVGAQGVAGIFSFHASKNIAAGEGGIVISNHTKIAERVRSLADCGRAGRSGRYRHVLLGGNFRMTEFQGAILSVALDRYPCQNRLRYDNALVLREALQQVDGVKPLELPENIESHAWHLFVMRVDPAVFGVDKQMLVWALLAEGLPARAGYDVQVFD